MPRPKKTIDLVQLEKLGSLHCTVEEVAAFFGMTNRNWRITYAKDKPIMEAFERGRSLGKMSLRRAQFLKATEGGNATMMIWLGKQLLGQREVVINEHFDGDSSDAETAKDKLYSRIAKLAAARVGRTSAEGDES